MNEPKIVVLPLDVRGKTGQRVYSAPATPNHNATCSEVRIMAIKDCIRCALCGRESQSLVAFALLAQACKTEGIKLKAPESSYFNPRCARRAFGEVNKKQRRSA